MAYMRDPNYTGARKNIAEIDTRRGNIKFVKF